MDTTKTSKIKVKTLDDCTPAEWDAASKVAIARMRNDYSSQPRDVLMDYSDSGIDKTASDWTDSLSIRVGVKEDSGKLDYSLVPSSWTVGDAEVMTSGAIKYPVVDNWKLVPNARARYYSALLRHLNAWYHDGEELDEGSGLNHMKHVRSNAGFLMELPVDSKGL